MKPINTANLMVWNLRKEKQPMKYVIEIPEETYKNVQWHGTFLNPRDTELLHNAFKDGTPLSEVLGDIKTEIEKLMTERRDCEVYTDLDEALEIIDSRTSGE